MAGARRGRRTDDEASLGFEATLWAAADKLRSSMDADQYKHVVLGLVFLKYCSDAQAQQREVLLAARRGAAADDPEAYRRAGAFWVPPEATWTALQQRAGSDAIGRAVDRAMAAIERENPDLRGALPRGYASPDLDKRRLGELVGLFSGVDLVDRTRGARDVLGRVYEYFLGQFAAAEGKRGGQFYTPRSVVRLLVEMLAPYKGRVYDPCCGSGGMFVQSEAFMAAHGGRPGDIEIYGQESNPTTWRLCRMNLAIRGLGGDLGRGPADTLLADLHPDLRADYILSNPPFNAGDWGLQRLREDPRWSYGAPPASSANFAWVQHFVHHLAPGGIAGFVLANGSLSSHQAGEGEIRRRLIEADLIDCIVALPGQLFYSTPIPVSLWLLARDKAAPRRRKRRGETLMIDARGCGHLVDRVHAELDDGEISAVAQLYRSWRGDRGLPPYADRPGFARAVTLDDLRAHRYTLCPGRYVGWGAAAEPVWDRAELAREMAEIEDRIAAVTGATRRVASLLTELLHG